MILAKGRNTFFPLSIKNGETPPTFPTLNILSETFLNIHYKHTEFIETSAGGEKKKREESYELGFFLLSFFSFPQVWKETRTK